MNGSNVRTSVVIEVANQEEPDDEKMYKIDFDDVEPPKGFVIDQIYCGEDVTVYALFEVSELNGELEKQLVEVSSSGISEDLKFYNKNPCQKAINDWTRNNILPASKQQSFYCLQHLGGEYEKTSGEENKDMKVLYSKDMASKHSRFKSVSVGVNTDIVQSPKLLEEVQRAVSLNLSQSKTEKNLEAPSLSSWKLKEVETEQSLSSIGSEVSGKKCHKKSSPNFLLVPLIMMEDGMLSQLKKDKIEKLEDVPKETISLGVNTESSMKPESKEGLKGSLVPENRSTGVCNEELSTHTDSNIKPQTLNKESILEEIKKLQTKLNSLIQSLEYNSTKTTNPDETTNITMKGNKPLKQCEAPFVLTVNGTSEEPSPVLSSYSLNPSREYSMIEATSVTNLVNSVTRNVSSTTHKACESITSQLELKTEVDEFIDWDIVLSKKGPGSSKSEFRCVDQKSAPGMKRSLSLNLKEVKPDAVGLKKLKNAFFKLEGNVKSKESTRLHLPEENLLSEKFPLLKCEMGDEAQEKLQCSKVSLNLKPVLNECEAVKGGRKNKNEEEGDAKVLNTSSTVHYCSASITPVKLKEEKGVLKGKPTDRNVEKGIKTIEAIKSKRTDAVAKKDVRVTTKANSRSKIENQAKPPSDTSDEAKPKSTPGSRKSTTRNSIDPKQVVEKGQKRAVEAPKTKLSQPSKLSGKEDIPRSRPPSQKQRRDSAASCADVKEKVANPRKGNVGQIMVFDRKVDSKDTATSKRDAEMVSTNPSSVIIELFSKKPPTLDENDSGMEGNFGEESSGRKDESGSDKPIAKSVWALTKVLLYEDGTKKFEVLEASLTPPDYSLQNGKKQDVRN